MIKLAAAQMQVSSSMEENYQKSLDYIRRAAEQGAKMICFPEGQLSHYIPQYPGRDKEDFAIGLDHPYLKGLCSACREAGIIASLGLCLEMDGNIYASIALISEKGELLGVGTKNHITYSEHFYEQDYFTPGTSGFQVINTSIGKIGLIVCFDRHYPESFRTCALKGADFIVVPVANERVEPNEMFQWEMRVAAFQNSVNVLMCNRVGVEGTMDFCGQSIFVRADGSVAALADDQEGLLIAKLDLDSTKMVREKQRYIPLRRAEVFNLG